MDTQRYAPFNGGALVKDMTGNWVQVTDHWTVCLERDALLAALKVLAAYPLEEFGMENKPDWLPLFGANEWQLTVGHVRRARAALQIPAPRLT